MTDRRQALAFAAAGTLLTFPHGARAQTDADLQGVLRANQDFDQALSRRDIAAVAQAWIQDDRVIAVHPNGKPPVVGWADVRRSWEGAFANYSELSVSMADPKVRLSGATALVVGAETIKGKRSEGGVVEFQAMTTNVYERSNGRWLMVHHQATRLA